MGARVAVHLVDAAGVSTGDVQIIDSRTIDDGRAEVLARVETAYQTRLAAGCVVTVQGVTKTYQIDVASQRLISGAALDAMLSQSVGGWPPDFYWIAMDNTKQPMSAADCIAFAITIKSYITALIYANRSLKDAAGACGSLAECDAFDEAQGWPPNP